MIAIDVMGGDYSPQAILHGAYLAAKNNIPVVLFGPQEMIVNYLSNINQSWQTLPITIYHAASVIAMGEEPVIAVKQGRDTSLVSAVESVRSGLCSAVLSAGNSGALMVASMLILGRKDGVERVPIAGFLPSLHGKMVALDLGANTECRPQHLLQFAMQGAIYAQENLGIEYPRVGLLSNGQEDAKGSTLVKESFKLLKNESSLNFIGNIEPEGVILHRSVDVMVCDGFSGNIFLKTMESTYDAFLQLTKNKVLGALPAREASEIVNVMNQFSPREQAGALLLGVKGNVVVCHGNSEGPTIFKAIKFAFSLNSTSSAYKKPEKGLNF